MSSGGAKASTPTLISDNLKSKQFLRVLDILSEGPIYGPVDPQHLSSFMLNNTPVTDEQGHPNINGVSIAWRPGSETQEPISGFNTVEATTIVNNEVKFDTPLVRTVTDKDVDRVRMNIGVSGLVARDTKGNEKNTSVTLVIETRTGNSAFTPVKTVTITGKISGEYLEAHIIDAPDGRPFDIRLRRITPDSGSDLLTNGTVWNSYTEMTDDNLSYPFTAVAGVVIDRDQYTETPGRTYHLRGLIVDVPDNYDPMTRTYTGLWTGGFKQAWTNNPAWLLRALVKNNRYGLARCAGNIDVDDGALYILSQYCDQQVNDGYGGSEPRMTLNAYITEQASARDIIDNIAGMFRGMVLWDGMQLSVMPDFPQDPIMSITNANVVDGKFSYSATKRSERYNAVVVSWTDPDNGWEQVKEYVSDDELIRRYGYNETTLEAFGCTSRGQAWRAGKWLLETAKRETSKVSFQMARDAIGFMPGDIVEIADNLRSATRLGGRIVSHSGATITADADVSALAGSGDTISLMGSEGKWVKYAIRSVFGRIITLSTAPGYVRDGTVFAIATSRVATRLFRIMRVAEDDNNSTYTITAAFHDPNKQAFVEASGQASGDIPGMTDLIDEAIRNSGAFEHLEGGVDTNIEAALNNALAVDAAVNHQWKQYGEVRADVITIRTTIADLDGSLAELTDIVQAQYGELTAAVNQKLIAEVKDDGSAKAFYTLNLGIVRNNIKYNTGFAMGIEPDGSGGYTSSTVFAADRFGVYSGSDPGNYQGVFFVFNGQVFINDAFIKNGSIDTAKIADVIMSSNFVWNDDPALCQGWVIRKDGFASFSNIDVVGTVRSNAGYFNNGTIGNCRILQDCVIEGKLSAANIQGNLVQGNAFSFELHNTAAMRVVRYEGNPLMPMRVYGSVMAVMHKQQKTRIFFNGDSTQPVEGLQIAKTGGSDEPYTYTSIFSFSRDLAKGEPLDINVSAGDLNQGAYESSRYEVMLWATPQSSGFSLV